MHRRYFKGGGVHSPGVADPDPLVEPVDEADSLLPPREGEFDVFEAEEPGADLARGCVISVSRVGRLTSGGGWGL